MTTFAKLNLKDQKDIKNMTRPEEYRYTEAAKSRSTTKNTKITKKDAKKTK